MSNVNRWVYILSRVPGRAPWCNCKESAPGTRLPYFVWSSTAGCTKYTKVKPKANQIGKKTKRKQWYRLDVGLDVALYPHTLNNGAPPMFQSKLLPCVGIFVLENRLSTRKSWRNTTETKERRYQAVSASAARRSRRPCARMVRKRKRWRRR